MDIDFSISIRSVVFLHKFHIKFGVFVIGFCYLNCDIPGKQYALRSLIIIKVGRPIHYLPKGMSSFVAFNATEIDEIMGKKAESSPRK